MMPGGSRDLRKIQLGQEVTAGTPVAATTIFRGNGGMIEDKVEVVPVEEDSGIIGGTTRRLVTRRWSELMMPAHGATFEQLPYPFSAGVEDVVTGAADGAGTGKIYQYDAPTTAQNSIQTYTMEGGDDVQAEECDYAFVQEINISGDSEGPLMVSHSWFARPASDTTFTGALSLVAVEDINFNSAKLYIDDTGGTWGTTEVSGVVRAMNLRWITGLQPWWAVDGSNEFQAHKLAGRTEEILLNLTFEHIAAAVTEKADYRSNALRLLQLKFEGSALGTPGTTYTYKTFILNLEGWYETWGPLEELDGNDIINVAMRVRYDPTDAQKAQAIIVNEVASLP
jgi:hypothetical protein